MGRCSTFESSYAILVLIFLLNLVPPVYTFQITKLVIYSKSAYAVSIVGFFIAVATLVFFAVMPLGGLFTSYMNKRSRRYIASQTFTANYIKLKGLDMWMSYLLWFWFSLPNWLNLISS